jgi:hypothetical protein
LFDNEIDCEREKNVERLGGGGKKRKDGIWKASTRGNFVKREGTTEKRGFNRSIHQL